MVGPAQGRDAGKVDLVADAHEPARIELRVQGARRIGKDKRIRAQPGHDAHAHADLVRPEAFVQMAAALLHQHGAAAQTSQHEGPGMGGHRGHREARQVGIGHADRVLHAFHEPRKTGAQDDGRIGPGGQRGPQTLAQRRHRKLDFFPVLHRIDPLRY